jgi:protein involved in polysaccharide export with SLBB domain
LEARLRSGPSGPILQAQRRMEMSLPTLRGMALMAVVLLLAGCATAQAPRAARTDYHPPSFGTWRADDYAYRIGPGDELSLQFLVNPDLNAKVIVR